MSYLHGVDWGGMAD